MTSIYKSYIHFHIKRRKNRKSILLYSLYLYKTSCQYLSKPCICVYKVDHCMKTTLVYQLREYIKRNLYVVSVNKTSLIGYTDIEKGRRIFLT